MEEDAYRSLLAHQQDTPVLVMTDPFSRKRWWMFRDEVYWEDDGFSVTEVKALILDKIEQKEKRIQRAVARVRQNESASSSTRQPIPDDVKLFVWQRDGGRCVKCGSQQNLEFDHIIPVSKGGSNTARNLQLLCEECNRSKGANLF
jgi:5-methylcytosine-specific restriction endonuclease McrA